MTGCWIELSPQAGDREVTVMNARFLRTLQVVTSLHVAILVVLLCIPFFNRLSFWRRTPTIIPVDLTVVVPDSGSSGSSTKDINAIIIQHKRDMAAIEREEKRRQKKLEEQRERERKEREEAQKREAKVKGPYLGPPSKNATDKPLSEAEIRRLLAQGYRPGDKNSIAPDEESRCFSLIKRALYDAWVPPGYDEVGGATAEVELRMQKDGSIFGRRMVRKSGNDVLDTSVMQAADVVKRVDGLTPAFLVKNEEVTIEFKVEPP